MGSDSFGVGLSHYPPKIPEPFIARVVELFCPQALHFANELVSAHKHYSPINTGEEEGRDPD
jgi:hypothetical protein